MSTTNPSNAHDFDDSDRRHQQLTASLLLATFIVVLRLFNVSELTRARFAPSISRLVVTGTKFVEGQQRMRCKLLDAVFNFMSVSVGVEFYITFLPFLFWIDQPQLARRCTLLMATAIYIGNSLKDVLCTDRPHGVQRLSVTDDHTKEFGFPSTHSLNSVCMFSYMLLHTKGFDPAALPLAPLAVIWCAGICYSRIYLGMHTPVDIIGGAAIGLALGVSWLFLGEYIDDVFTSHPYSIPLHLLLSLVLLSCYPTPKRPTPSYKYCVYFAGVAVGGNIGLLRTRLLQPLLPPLDPQLSIQFAIWSMKRFAAGIAVVIACLLLTDSILKAIMPPIFRILRIPVATDNDASPRVFTTNSGRTYFAHIDTCRRFITYGVVCWSVVEPALLLIRYLQL